MSKVILDSPANAQTGVSTGGPLVWNAVEGWDRYRLEVTERDPLLEVGEEFEENEVLINRFITDVVPVDGKISFVADPPLSNQTEYVWRVRAARVAIEDPEPEVLSVTVNPSSASLKPGDTIQFIANVSTVGDASTAVTWESSDESAMTVNSSGLGTAHLEQTPTITARSVFDPTKTGTSSVSIVQPLQTIDSIAGDLAALTALYNSTSGASWTNNAGWLAGNPSNNWHGITVNGAGRVTKVDLRSNNLVGVLPTELGNLKWCEWLNVKGNFLTGQIPASIGEMTRLKYLYLAGKEDVTPSTGNNDYHPGKESPETNTFAGSILPPEFENLPDIRHIEISQTEIEGPLPPGWGAMSTIERIYLNAARTGQGVQGKLTGNLPPEWAGMINLTHISFNYNPLLGGPLPPEWAAWSKMRAFRMRDTPVTGNIPPEWETWGSTLRLMYIRSGNLSGVFPAWLIDDRSPLLHTMELTYNNFTSIEDVNPDNVSFKPLAVWGLDWNNIVMDFPEYAKVFTRMQAFRLRGGGNKVTGNVPDDFFQGWNNVRNIYFDGLDLGGTLPSSFGSASTNQSTNRLQFHNAGFVGKIPPEWVNYQTNGILWFYLNSNELHGAVPVGFADFPWVASGNGLRLHSNRFTYSDLIPLLNEWPSDITITYQTQKPFPVDEYTSANPSGSSIAMDLSGIHVTGNVYQWRRNGNNISNGTGIAGATSHTLELSGAGVVAGQYTLRITNSNAPQLEESISQPITVS